MSTLTESKILAGLIQSTEFMKSIHADTQARYFSTKVGREICNFTLKFYDKFGEAPREQIDDYLAKLLKENRPEEEVKDVLQIVDRLANKTEINENYITQTAYDYFKTQDALFLSESIKDAVYDGDNDELDRLVKSYKLVDKPQVAGVDPHEEEVYTNAIEEANEPVFTVPGDYGTFINAELYRGSFVTFLGRTKVGKTWYLMDLAIHAMNQGKKVAFIQAGDMSQNQFINRYYTSLLRRNYSPEYCREHYSPLPDCLYNQNGTCTKTERESNVELFYGADKEEMEGKSKRDIVEAIKTTKNYIPCTSCMRCPYHSYEFEGVVTYRKIPTAKPFTAKDMKKANEEDLKGCKSLLKLASYPNNSLTPTQIETLIDGWAKEDFVPDVLIVDYLDIMTVDHKMRDQRAGIKNDVAMGLRRVSQLYNLCLITATQSDVVGWKSKTLNMSNFADDSRLLHHVTCLIGINQTVKEQERGLTRLNKIVSRSEAATTQQLKATQNLAVGKPIMKSWS